MHFHTAGKKHIFILLFIVLNSCILIMFSCHTFVKTDVKFWTLLMVVLLLKRHQFYFFRFSSRTECFSRWRLQSLRPCSSAACPRTTRTSSRSQTFSRKPSTSCYSKKNISTKFSIFLFFMLLFKLLFQCHFSHKPICEDKTYHNTYFSFQAYSSI